MSSTSLETEDDITFNFKYEHRFYLNYYDGTGTRGPIGDTLFSFGVYVAKLVL